MNESYQLIVLYARVSSEGQNVEMQLSAAHSYLKDSPASELVFLIDEGVSATKLKMNRRMKLVELLDLVKKGRVKRLYVYDRDRLARDYYEYMFIAQLLVERQVEVIFTGTNVRPFDKTLVMEAIGAIFAQLEGQAIRRRKADSQKQYPTNLLGYMRSKVDNSVTYALDESVSDHIERLFYEVSSVNSPEHFVSILEEFKRRLNRNPQRLVNILQTPFYAAHWEREGTLYPLMHVPAIVDLDTYNSVQARLNDFQGLIQAVCTPAEPSNLPQPSCGKCNQKMQLRSPQLGRKVLYRCSKHRDICIDLDVYNDLVQREVRKLVTHLDYQRFQKDCSAFVTTLARKSRATRQLKEQQLSQMSVELTRLYLMRPDEAHLSELIFSYQNLASELENVSNHILLLDNLNSQVARLTQLVADEVAGEVLNSTENLKELATLLIKRVVITPPTLKLEVGCAKYFDWSGGGTHVS